MQTIQSLTSTFVVNVLAIFVVNIQTADAFYNNYYYYSSYYYYSGSNLIADVITYALPGWAKILIGAGVAVVVLAVLVFVLIYMCYCEKKKKRRSPAENPQNGTIQISTISNPWPNQQFPGTTVVQPQALIIQPPPYPGPTPEENQNPPPDAYNRNSVYPPRIHSTQAPVST